MEQLIFGAMIGACLGLLIFLTKFALKDFRKQINYLDRCISNKRFDRIRTDESAIFNRISSIEEMITKHYTSQSIEIQHDVGGLIRCAGYVWRIESVNIDKSNDKRATVTITGSEALYARRGSNNCEVKE